jgi:hypothetical protein
MNYSGSKVKMSLCPEQLSSFSINETAINLGERINYKLFVTESGCVPLPFLKNGQIVESYRGAVVKFLCNPGYALYGSSFTYCDGVVWNGTIPECKGDLRV